MTARQKIENLTTAWVGFMVVAALVSLLLNGLGIISTIVALVSTTINVLIVLFLGRKLMAGSGATRLFLVVVASLGAVLGALGTALAGWALLHSFTFALLGTTVLVGANTYMNLRSLKVLLHRTVKAHCS